MTSHKRIVIGAAVKPFGIKGELRIKVFTETDEPFLRSKVLFMGEQGLKVDGVRVHKGAALVRLEGVNTPEKAREYVGCLVSTDAANLPPPDEDEYYWHELIGMTVTTVSGTELGRITSIIPTPAHDVLEVHGPFGEVLLPMVDEVVKEIDAPAGRMTVDPIDGLVPDA
ncbi:MAG: ribosome maturation factor RimM [Pseudomonadota bacterium]